MFLFLHYLWNFSKIKSCITFSWWTNEWPIYQVISAWGILGSIALKTCYHYVWSRVHRLQDMGDRWTSLGLPLSVAWGGRSVLLRRSLEGVCVVMMCGIFRTLFSFVSKHFFKFWSSFQHFCSVLSLFINMIDSCLFI